ncbi:MAG: hypothetical protein DRP58_08300 [Spirochaetes bacterium]|nr:MAG: hypothetical protein DRP58_08300 [Spirochaetota bacterium]
MIQILQLFNLGIYEKKETPVEEQLWGKLLGFQFLIISVTIKDYRIVIFKNLFCNFLILISIKLYIKVL